MARPPVTAVCITCERWPPAEHSRLCEICSELDLTAWAAETQISPGDTVPAQDVIALAARLANGAKMCRDKIPPGARPGERADLAALADGYLDAARLVRRLITFPDDGGPA